MVMGDLIQIWCDGSYRQEHGTIGVGWVHSVRGQTHEESRTLPNIKDTHGSDIAEYTAFAKALETVPDGANVSVHMDCQNVVDTLMSGTLSRKHKAIPAIVSAFTAATNAKKRMGSVQIKYTSDRNSPNMGLAHTLSRMASTPPKKPKGARP